MVCRLAHFKFQLSHSRSWHRPAKIVLCFHFDCSLEPELPLIFSWATLCQLPVRHFLHWSSILYSHFVSRSSRLDLTKNVDHQLRFLKTGYRYKLNYGLSVDSSPPNVCVCVFFRILTDHHLQGSTIAIDVTTKNRRLIRWLATTAEISTFWSCTCKLEWWILACQSRYPRPGRPYSESSRNLSRRNSRSSWKTRDCFLLASK